MDLSADFSSFQEAVKAALITSTRTAGQIASEDLSFHRSSSSAFSTSLDAQNIRLLQLTNRLLKAASSDAHSDVKAPQLDDIDSIEDNWRSVVDVVDDLLEKADRSIDEVTGVIKRASPKRDVGEGKSRGASLTKSRYFSSLTKKPQQYFESEVDNFETGPWRPLLKSKPHATVPLEEVPEDTELGSNHPYAEEIASYKYPEDTYKVSSPIAFTPPEESEAIFVDTEEAVAQMLEELKQADTIAVDLEHHDMHSYIGLVCLMQISTRNKDWIVDTLKPWRQNLQVLNEVFADPRIVKVFHGSTFDMIWLQRDLGLYVVGLFDTFHAARALNFPKKSLKYLLERFANFEAQKEYQMSDWRIRPLPAELVDYARSDTHYLLHVFDKIRNMLIEASTPDNNLVDFVLEQSKKEALQRYQRPVYDRERGLGPVSWYGPLSKRSIKFTNEQFGVFRAVHEWRDEEARKQDESPAAILGLNTLFTIANNMPSSTPALLAAANPVSKSVRDNVDQILEIIKKGREGSISFPSLWDIMQQNDAFRKQRRPWETEKAVSNTTLKTAVASDSAEVPDSTVTRSILSRLWGGIIKKVSGSEEPKWKTDVTEDTVSRIMPVPTDAKPLNVATITEVSVPPPTTSTESRNDIQMQENKANEIFTLKDLKRRSEAAGAGKQVDHAAEEADANADGITLTESTAKSDRKARRKEEKRLKKLGLAGTTITTDTPENPTTNNNFFDYSTAPSVLHPSLATHSSGPGKEGGKKNKRPFDPYAKAMDGPKGAKKVKRDETGKSFTFRN